MINSTLGTGTAQKYEEGKFLERSVLLAVLITLIKEALSLMNRMLNHTDRLNVKILSIRLRCVGSSTGPLMKLFNCLSRIMLRSAFLETKDSLSAEVLKTLHLFCLTANNQRPL